MKFRYFLYFNLMLILSVISACGGSGGDDSSDTIPPNIVANINPNPNAEGWHNTDVTVSFECTDADSGIDACPADVTVSAEGAAHIISGTASDEAGNTATTQVTLNIDKTPASMVAESTPSPNAAGWFNTDVTINFICSDNLSGVASCPGMEVLTTEGAGQVVNVSTTDIAGNSATFEFTFNIDKTVPGITASTLTSPNLNGWFNDDVTVAFDCSDDLSGVDVCTNTLLVTTEGEGQIISGSVTDLAGNMAATDIMLDMDKTAPSITVNTPEEAARIFGYLPPVAVEGTADDTLSGLVSLTCNSQVATINASTFECDVDVVDGENTITVFATDEAGNTGSYDRIITYLEPELELAFYDTHQIIWSSFGSDLSAHASFFIPVTENMQPVTTEGFHLLGHFGYQGLETIPNGYAIAVREVVPDSGALARPQNYVRVWDSVSTGLGATLAGAFWKPIPPEGYSCLGLLITNDINTAPDNNAIRCVRSDLVIPPANQFSYDVYTLFSADYSEVTIPFLATHIVPKKSDPTATHAIYPGTFNGTSYASLNQDVELMNWLNGEKVLHVAMPAADVNTLIQLVGPLVWLHPLEIYFPDIPENILDFADLHKAIILYESNYDLFQVINPESRPTSADSFFDDYEDFVLEDERFYLSQTPPLIENPWFKSWIEYDPLLAIGNLGVAKAFVNVLPVDAIFTDLQFWFYYPYNGPGRITVTIGVDGIAQDFQLAEGGRHTGDWEHVTMRILNQTQNMTQHQLVGVYMSRHSGGQWFSRNYFGSQLGFDGTHPIVYSGKFSHAFYSLVHSHIIYETKYRVSGYIRVDSFDETGLGYAFPAFTAYEIINSDVKGVNIDEKNWLSFKGRWGGYEFLSENYVIDSFEDIGAGPYGPNMKNDFNFGDPFDWYWAIKVTHE